MCALLISIDVGATLWDIKKVDQTGEGNPDKDDQNDGSDQCQC
jgi:hypothetical protein